MAEIRVNATGGVKFYDADDSHYAQINAGTITSDTDVLTLGHDAVVAGTKVDLNGQELILDADADTSITADTDDQIDVRIAGADDFQFTANTFTAQSGSSIVVPDGGLTFGSTAISSTAAELNLLDGVTSTTAELNILDGVTSTAAELNIVDGNTSATSTTIADADRIVLNDNGTMVQAAVTDLKTYIGGGGLVHISTTTASSSSGVNINGPFTTTYDHYLVMYEINFSADGGKARARFQNTSNAEQSDTYHQSSARDSGGGSVNGNFNNTSYFILNDDGQSNFDNIPLYGHMYVSNPRVDDARCGFRNFATTSDSGRNGGFEVSAGHLNENTEISGIKIYPDSGSFDDATIRIYGIANS